MIWSSFKQVKSISAVLTNVPPALHWALQRGTPFFSYVFLVTYYNFIITISFSSVFFFFMIENILLELATVKPASLVHCVPCVCLFSWAGGGVVVNHSILWCWLRPTVHYTLPAAQSIYTEMESLREGCWHWLPPSVSKDNGWYSWGTSYCRNNSVWRWRRSEVGILPLGHIPPLSVRLNRFTWNFLQDRTMVNITLSIFPSQTYLAGPVWESH